MKNILLAALSATLFLGFVDSSYGQIRVTKKTDNTRKRTIKKDSTAVEQSIQNNKVPNQQVPTIQNKEILEVALNDDAVIVSSPYQRVLQDNGTFIDERGYDQPTFDLIKKKNGDFALAYASSTENLDIRTKGILFTLKPDLSQKGSALIFTKHQEEIRDLKLDEFFDGIISIAYTCNDDKCVFSNGHRDNTLTILKYSEIGRDGKVQNREVDDIRSKIELKAMLRPAPSDDISVLYNVDGKGKVALATSNLNSYVMSCDLQQLQLMESSPNGKSVQPKIGSVSMIDGRFIIHTISNYKTMDWNLSSKGLLSGRIEKPVWPLLVLDGYCVSNDNGGFCSYNNYPYHRFTDNQLNVGEINQTFVLNNSDLGVLSVKNNSTFLHTFDSQLNRSNPPLELAKNIRLNSMQIEEVDATKILLFYKTDEGDSVSYRFTLYDWKNNKVLWEDHIAWTEADTQWENVHKITRFDNNKFVVVSFADGDGPYKHQQTLEYRLITINVKE